MSPAERLIGRRFLSLFAAVSACHESASRAIIDELDVAEPSALNSHFTVGYVRREREAQPYEI